MVKIQVFSLKRAGEDLVPLAQILQDKTKIGGGQLAALLAWWSQSVAPVPLVQNVPYLPKATEDLFRSLLKATQQHGARRETWVKLLSDLKEKGGEGWARVKEAVHALREEAMQRGTRQVAWNALAATLTKEAPPPEENAEAPPPSPSQPQAPGPETALLQELQRWRDDIEKRVAGLAEDLGSLRAQVSELRTRLEEALEALAREAPPEAQEDSHLEEEVSELREAVDKLTRAFNEVVVGKLLRAYVAGSLLMVKVEKVPPLPEEILRVLEDIHARATREPGQREEEKGSSPKNPLLSWLRRPQ